MKKTRREFLRDLGISFVGITHLDLATNFLGKKIYAEESQKSKVVLAYSEKVLNSEGKIEIALLKSLVNKSLEKLTGLNSNSAWKSLFNSKDVVGIKVNAIAGRELSSHPELVKIIGEELISAGVNADNIVIFDRSNFELKRAGFKINFNKKGVKCFGTDTSGIGYDLQPSIVGSLTTCFSRIVSSFCTALINVPVLKDHDLAGITVSLKNNLGCINNPNKCHPNKGNPHIADVNSSPLIKEKTRLIICDAIRTCYEGGPSYKPEYAWDFKTILVSQDPVALDTIGLEEIEKKRQEKKLPSLKKEGRYPEYLETAAKYKLGKNKLSQIELIKLKI